MGNYTLDIRRHGCRTAAFLIYKQLLHYFVFFMFFSFNG